MSRQKMIVLGVVLVVMAIACTANAALTAKASSEFTYKYEMDYMPSDVANVDLDSNSISDFDLVKSPESSWTASGGFSTMNTGALDDYGVYLGALVSGKIWPGKTTFANGYTIEFSAQLLSHNGVRGTMGMNPISSGSTTSAFLSLYEGGELWGASADIGVGSHNNADGQHIFRLVQQPGVNTYSVWRDGELLSDSLAGVTGTGDTFGFGDIGNKWGGVAVFDYLRFTSGAYAPVPEPSSLTLLAAGLLGLLAYAWRKRK